MEITLNYKGVELEIEYDHQPYEAEVRYYSDGSGYPGCAEEAAICEIKLNGVDVTELLEDNIEELEEKILEQLHEY